MKDNLLVGLDEVKATNSSFFVELTKGYYKDETEETTFWAESSLYVYGDIWANCLDGLAKESITNYDFLDFTDVSEQDNQIFCENLLILADKLDTFKYPSDLQSEAFLTNKQEPYIRFDNSLHDIVEQTPNQSEIAFNKNFDMNVKMIAKTYRDLAAWLTKNRSYGVSILGI